MAWRRLGSAPCTDGRRAGVGMPRAGRIACESAGLGWPPNAWTLRARLPRRPYSRSALRSARLTVREEAAARARPHWVPKELEKLERHAASEGYGAIVDALLLCQKEQWPVPDWVTFRVGGLIREAGHLMADAKPALPRGRGRGNNPVRAYYQRLIHFIRWDRVVELREARRAEREQVAIAREREPEWAAWLLRTRAEFGPPLGKARDDGTGLAAEFNIVAKSLARTVAGGSGHAMRDSFRLVQRAPKLSPWPAVPPAAYKSFYWPTKEALELLGWEALWVAVHEGNSDFFNPLRRGKNQRK